MSIWWSLHLRREAASVPLARRLLLGTMETAGVDPDISYDLSVALSEACANAVEHGGSAEHGGSLEHGGGSTDPAAGGSSSDSGSAPAGCCVSSDGAPARTSPGAFQVTAYLDGDMCRIEVTDSGPGFPPPGRSRPTAAQPDLDAEHGRGLCLIQEIADHASFANKPGRSGAVVSFDKILKWRTDAPLVTA
ncbi:ATP-binding protein [Streptomyces sp. Da 82-17]|uniref:ATP-binding protein n=1 Tax=Streptomyces sp. Da 82-17 TaxID=3377116 RepID=UPI0038D386F5